MQQYTFDQQKIEEEEEKKINNDPLNDMFNEMMEKYDFMSIVMYQELKNRREFIHDCWIIAKSKENDELKLAIITDPFFYLTREDLLVLLKTQDSILITKILKI